VAVVAPDRLAGETQRGAYSLLLVLSGVALGVSGLPAPLYGMYEEVWHLSPLSTTVVFAAYAVAALGRCWYRAVSPTWSDASRSCWPRWWR
jgi:hypothetical protein